MISKSKKAMYITICIALYILLLFILPAISYISAYDSGENFINTYAAMVFLFTVLIPMITYIVNCNASIFRSCNVDCLCFLETILIGIVITNIMIVASMSEISLDAGYIKFGIMAVVADVAVVLIIAIWCIYLHSLNMNITSLHSLIDFVDNCKGSIHIQRTGEKDIILNPSKIKIKDNCAVVKLGNIKYIIDFRLHMFYILYKNEDGKWGISTRTFEWQMKIGG